MLFMNVMLRGVIALMIWLLYLQSWKAFVCLVFTIFTNNVCAALLDRPLLLRLLISKRLLHGSVKDVFVTLPFSYNVELSFGVGEMERALAPLFIALTCHSKCIKHNVNVVNHAVKQTHFFSRCLQMKELLFRFLKKEGQI